MVIAKFKRCSECQKELETSHFYRRGSHLYSHCKACISMDRKTHYQHSRVVKNKGIINIFVQRLNHQIDINKGDLLSIVEAFLFEEWAK